VLIQRAWVLVRRPAAIPWSEAVERVERGARARQAIRWALTALRALLVADVDGAAFALVDALRALGDDTSRVPGPRSAAEEAFERRLRGELELDVLGRQVRALRAELGELQREAAARGVVPWSERRPGR
jgi:hypothetical protein